MVAGTIFKQVWKLVSGEEEAPKARESEYGWREVLAAAATQGAVFGSSRRPSTAAVLRDSAS
jgi:hypothetical protein